MNTGEMTRELFEMMLEEQEQELLLKEFYSMSDEDSNVLSGVTPTKVEVISGWYQNTKGTLYHYDGLVWDIVPAEPLKNLEFLGRAHLGDIT
jgi:hypothetical protein